MGKLTKIQKGDIIFSTSSEDWETDKIVLTGDAIDVTADGIDDITSPSVEQPTYNNILEQQDLSLTIVDKNSDEFIGRFRTSAFPEGKIESYIEAQNYVKDENSYQNNKFKHNYFTVGVTKTGDLTYDCADHEKFMEDLGIKEAIFNSTIGFQGLAIRMGSDKVRPGANTGISIKQDSETESIFEGNPAVFVQVNYSDEFGTTHEAFPILAVTVNSADSFTVYAATVEVEGGLSSPISFDWIAIGKCAISGDSIIQELNELKADLKALEARLAGFGD
jgi:hypothetical protein